MVMVMRNTMMKIMVVKVRMVHMTVFVSDFVLYLDEFENDSASGHLKTLFDTRMPITSETFLKCTQTFSPALSI